jgi:squalene cyclase
VNPENRAAQNGIQFLLENQRENGSWQEQCVGIYWEIIGGYADPIYASVFPILALNQFLQTPL